MQGLQESPSEAEEGLAKGVIEKIRRPRYQQEREGTILRLVPGEPCPVPSMQFPMGPACIFLRKGIAEKQRERPLGQDEIEELREAFLEFDKDRDGFISCKDLGNLMRTMGYMPTEMELTELGQQIRMNLGGRVDFDDFVELMTPKLLAETAGMIGVQEMRDAFKEFDTNGDGEITLGELQQAMQRLLGEKLTPQEISEVVREADMNGDGTVDFEGDVVWGQLWWDSTSKSSSDFPSWPPFSGFPQLDFDEGR
ncbi:calcium-binding protein 5 [Tamandua tetradactyla]|uniref:calcium-binding protein 5 n=1 Tax=Tamandua tetradactyla TaxID=48850 RepID=UPI004053A492